MKPWISILCEYGKKIQIKEMLCYSYEPQKLQIRSRTCDQALDGDGLVLKKRNH